MSEFIRGQRWVSETEPELGLGQVVGVEARLVTLNFAAAGENRVYARNNAPLARVLFTVGDPIEIEAGLSLRVLNTEQRAGLVIYLAADELGQEHVVPETMLSHSMQFGRPQDRLLAGQVDDAGWFELRLETRLQRQRLESSAALGLLGPRASLVPHQLYIANEVTQRPKQRVLLADEVGLGKTIEAGLILYRLVLLERVRRALVIVPDSLQHQWLVEMLRRFNLRFSLFDDERCEELKAEGQNPFASESLVLISLDLLLDRDGTLEELLACDWDMLVVDEAHHLRWSPEAPSPQYEAVEALAQTIDNVLLLTATPEQLGRASHFARLRLLDPHRFHDYQTFLDEEQAFAPVAEVVAQLDAGGPLSAPMLAQLQHLLGERYQAAIAALAPAADSATEAAASESSALRESLIQALIDRHGTSRLLFRNTRAAIQGFPGRQLHAYPLPVPEVYQTCHAKFQASWAQKPVSKVIQAKSTLYPEIIYERFVDAAAEDWWKIDPRLPWLAQTIKSLRPEKLLVICAQPQTALDVDEYLHQQGIISTVFYEGMTLVARDRAAAYFAASEDGAQVLVCSEIGSEGRNFQFAQHLIMFDLPLNPDLLEQRIGRLDRIGQRGTVQVHVPYFVGTGQEVLQQWYHLGIDGFEHTCPAGPTVFAEVNDELHALMLQPEPAALQRLLERSHARYQALMAELESGRDKLLERHSFQPEVAQRLMNAMRELEQKGMRAGSLESFLRHVFDSYGFDFEPHTQGTFILQQGEDTQLAHFPELPDDGMVLTFDRAIALAREDIQFMTWDHPLTRGIMDWAVQEQFGNSALLASSYPGLPPGTLLLEAVLVPMCPAPKAWLMAQHLPQTPVRLWLDPKHRLLKIDPALLEPDRMPVDAPTARKILVAHKDQLRAQIQAAEQAGLKQLPALQAAAVASVQQHLDAEILRLQALAEINANVRPDEIAALRQQKQGMLAAVERAKMRLDAVRVWVIAK